MAGALPELIALRPFDLFAAHEQCVVRLDPADGDRLARDAPHRLARLPAAAAPQRRLEYLAARAAAAMLLRSQGSACIEVESEPDRAPIWPRGYTGSITHSALLAAVVVRATAPGASVGIDAQPLLDRAEASEVAGRCIHPGELADCVRRSGLSDQQVTTLLFSAREAFFKCVDPAAQRQLWHLDVRVSALDLGSGRFELWVLNAPTPGLPAGQSLTGSFSFGSGHAFTAFEMPGAGLQAPTGV